MKGQQDSIVLGQLCGPLAQKDAIHIAIAPVECGERLSPGQVIGFVKGSQTVVTGNPKVALGIIDPYLVNNLKKGDWCYMLMFPNTITSLRHEWTHPAFQKQSPKKLKNLKVSKKDKIQYEAYTIPKTIMHSSWESFISAPAALPQPQQDEENEQDEYNEVDDNPVYQKDVAIQWLENYADNLNMSYAQLMQAIEAWLQDGEYYILVGGIPQFVNEINEEFWKYYCRATDNVVEEEMRTVFFKTLPHPG